LTCPFHCPMELLFNSMGLVERQIERWTLQSLIYHSTCWSNYSQNLMIKLFRSQAFRPMWCLFGQSLLNTMQDMEDGQGYDSSLSLWPMQLQTLNVKVKLM